MTNANTMNFTATISDEIVTTSESVLDFGDGLTLEMDSARTTWTYVDGSKGVLSSGADVVLIDDTPAVTHDVNGYDVHGLMLGEDIVEITATDGSHGWTEQAEHVGVATRRTSYDTTKNKAPSFTSSNLTVALAGDSGNVVKVRNNPDDDVLDRAFMEQIAVMSVVSVIPKADEIRPPQWGTIDEPLRLSDADFSRVRSFTMPDLSALRTVGQCIDFMQKPQIVAAQEGESRRGIHSGVSVGFDDYARDALAKHIAPAFLHMVNSTTSTADRDALLAGFMQKAVDAYGAFGEGMVMQGGAGQILVDHFCLAVVAALCPNKTFLKTQSIAMRSNLNDQSEWITSGNVGNLVRFNDVVGSGADSFLNAHPIMPEHVGYSLFIAEADVRTTRSMARYKNIATTEVLNTLTILGLIEDGWECIFGLEATWDTSNDLFATVANADHHKTLFNTHAFSENSWSVNSPLDEIVEIWDAERATFPEGASAVSIFTRTPEMLDADSFTSSGFLTETATGADYDYGAFAADGTAFTGSVLPITGRQLRLSHDGIQFAAPVTASTSGSLAFTGNRYIQERRQNSEGYSPWSANYSNINGTTAPERAVLTGGTIPTGAPVNTTIPKLFTYRYQTGFPLYDELTEPVADEVGRLIAGVGLWADGIASVSYQWQSRENEGVASDITDATDAVIPRTLTSTPSTTVDVRCQITASDGNGNTTTVESGWLTMPQGVAYLFDAFFETDVSSLFESYLDSTLTYDPAGGFLGVLSNENFGGVRNKDGVILSPGTDILIKAHVKNIDDAQGLQFRVGGSKTSTPASSTTPTPVGEDVVMELPHTVDPSGEVHFRINTNFAGAGKTFEVSRVTIEEVF